MRARTHAVAGALFCPILSGCGFEGSQIRQGEWGEGVSLWAADLPSDVRIQTPGSGNEYGSRRSESGTSLPVPRHVSNGSSRQNLPRSRRETAWQLYLRPDIVGPARCCLAKTAYSAPSSLPPCILHRHCVGPKGGGCAVLCAVCSSRGTSAQEAAKPERQTIRHG